MNLITNSGGLAGGGVMVPFMMLFLEIPIKECIPLAKSLGLISSVIRIILRHDQRHPNNQERLAIDYEIVTLSVPLLCLGAFFGIRLRAILTAT